MSFLLRIAAFVLVLASSPAMANSWGVDRSDGWWNANESGWGVMLAQQQDGIFIAMFVYAPNGQPTWFTGLLAYDYNDFYYGGTLFESTGPSHLGPFNPNLVNRRAVGRAELVTAGESRFTLIYTVDGVTVTKSIERLTWASNDLGGLHFGGFVGTTSNCSQPGLNGALTLIANLSIQSTPSTLRFSGEFANNRGLTTTCSFAGNYQQAGRLGTSSGTYSCASGEVGTFALEGIEVTVNGILASARASSNVCSFQGRFGAIRN